MHKRPTTKTKLAFVIFKPIIGPTTITIHFIHCEHTYKKNEEEEINTNKHNI